MPDCAGDITRQIIEATIQSPENAGQWQVIRLLLQIFVEGNPQDIEFHLMLIDINIRLKDYSSAMQHLKEAYQIQPKSSEVFKRMAMLHYLLKDFQKAEKTFFGTLSMKPDDPDTWVNLAKLYYDIKQYPKAQNCLLQAQQLSPHDLEIVEALALVRSKF